MNSKYAAQKMENNSVPLSYFGYTKYESGHEARDDYQIFYENGNPDSWSDARLLGEFDPLQLYKNELPQVQVPLANGGRGPGYELFTSAYPEYVKVGHYSCCRQNVIILLFLSALVLSQSKYYDR